METTIAKHPEELIRTVEDIRQRAIERGLSLELTVHPEHERELSYWYGGEVARVNKGNISLLLEANGDVRCKYRHSEGGEEIYVKDKNNQGTFAHEFDSVIQGDEQLLEFRNNFEEDKYPQLEIQNNNWWEVFVVIDGEWHDIECVVEADTYTQALTLLIHEFDDYVAMTE